MKSILAIVIICAFFLSVGVAGAQVDGRLCAEKGGVVTENKCMLTINAKISIDYPIDLAQNQFIANIVDPFIQSIKDDFLQAIGHDFQPMPNPSYELGIRYEVARHSQSIVSLIFTVDEYTGGGHDNISIVTYTFDTANNHLIALHDLFTNMNDALNIAAPIVQATIAKGLGDGNQPDVLQSGTSIDPKNYGVFSLDVHSITFYFQSYQIAAGILGPQQVTIPLAQLSSVLKPEFAS